MIRVVVKVCGGKGSWKRRFAQGWVKTKLVRYLKWLRIIFWVSLKFVHLGQSTSWQMISLQIFCRLFSTKFTWSILEYFVPYDILTHLMLLLSFYTPWKHQKAIGCLVFSRGMKWKFSEVFRVYRKRPIAWFRSVYPFELKNKAKKLFLKKNAETRINYPGI